MAKWGTCDFSQLEALQKSVERLQTQEREAFFEACAKELAARLLAKVIRRTPARSPDRGTTGTLRRGWTAIQSQGFAVTKSGSNYEIELVNPTYYASYVEYGHRTANHSGWVEGQYFLSLSEEELKQEAPALLQKKLNQFIRECFGG